MVTTCVVTPSVLTRQNKGYTRGRDMGGGEWVRDGIMQESERVMCDRVEVAKKQTTDRGRKERESGKVHNAREFG